MSHEQIRRALDDAKRREGMTVGLPQVKVDVSQLQHLLAAHDHWQERAEKAQAKLGRLTDAIQKIIRADQSFRRDHPKADDWLSEAIDAAKSELEAGNDE